MPTAQRAAGAPQVSRRRGHLRWGGLLAVVAAAGALAVPAARAAAPPEDTPSSSVVEEMAGALGFESSHSEGFWEALAQARVTERERMEAERLERAQQVIADAAKYGRRTEVNAGPATTFTEYIPPADGDIVDGTVFIRFGTEYVRKDGTIEVSTKYYDGFTAIGLVVSVIKDGVETVTNVIEYRPGAIDVKVGDTRPVPPPAASAAGKKPHTLDPKADGSFGLASGNHPDEPPAPEAAPPQETGKVVLPDKADDTLDNRLEFAKIDLPGGRTLKPFLETKAQTGPDDLPYRSGYDILDQNKFGDAIARITVYFTPDGKAAGLVGTVLHHETETVVAVEELKPGSIGLKPGDTRPAPPNSGSGNKPTTWDPKPQSDGGSGSKGGERGSDPIGGDRTKPEAPPKADGDDTAGAESKGGGDEWHQISHSQSSDKDGSSWQQDTYQLGDQDLSKDVETWTDADGKSTTTTTCYSTQGSQECPSGMTDEPTCRSDCERMSMLTEFFYCVSGAGGSDCGEPAVETRGDATGGGPACDQIRSNDRATSANAGGWSIYDCSNPDRPGGPADYGDPNDPNGAEAPDPTQPIVRADDGVTDPVEPGELEGEPDILAALPWTETLPDPVNPLGREDLGAPGDGQPTTGDAEWRDRP